MSKTTLMYRKVGFVEVGQVPIDYAYINTSAAVRIPKVECPDPFLHKIYDCGQTQWVLNL